MPISKHGFALIIFLLSLLSLLSIIVILAYYNIYIEAKYGYNHSITNCNELGVYDYAD